MLFILGLSRAGKTTAESIISTQGGVKRGYENPAIDNAITAGFQMGGLITFSSLAQLPLQLYPTVRDVYRKHIDKLLGDGNLFTNTSPGHIWDVPYFFEAIPNMRYVFIKRNIDDLMLRIYMRKYRMKNLYSYEIKALNKYIIVYNKLIDVYMEMFPSISCVINYEDMIGNPASALDEICELCGNTPDHSILPKQIANDIGCAKPYKRMMQAALERW